MVIDEREAIRYLGYGKNQPDDNTMKLIHECMEEVTKQSEPKHILRRFELEMLEDDSFRAGNLLMKSHSLSKNLTGCSEVILMAATLGNSIDRLLNKYLKLYISKAAVLQAVAAAAIEAYCNEIQIKLEEEVAKEGLFVRPRFSPGYGDLPLDIQGDFLKTLEASKRVGIVLSEGNIMLPEKSVTAIMGLSTENTHCVREGCEICGKNNCLYRRN